MPTNVRTVRLASVNPTVRVRVCVFVCVSACACACVCQCVKLFKQLSDSINNKNIKKGAGEKDRERESPSQVNLLLCQLNLLPIGRRRERVANCKYLFNTFVAHIQWQ